MANPDAFDKGFKQGLGKSKNSDDKADNGGKKDPGGGLGKDIPGFKKGGRVKKTGVAKVHKGEVVLTAKQARSLKKSGRKRVAGKR